MRTNQGIFQAVIRAGYYNSTCHESYMCSSLVHAKNAGVISDKEFTLAGNAIKKYMDELSGKDRKYFVLSTNLYISGFEDYSAEWYKGGGDKFYWNWNKRPRK